jgi:Tfp pilus assembly protein PilX
MRTIRIERVPNRQRGSVLVVTLLVSSIIAITLMAYLALIGYQNRAVLRAQAWNYEVPVAEAGIEEALTHLYYSRGNLATNGWTLGNNAWWRSRMSTRR